MSARDDILRQVRAALAAPRADAAAISVELAAIPRDYQSASSMTSEERIELLCDRLRDYDANVHRCAEGEVAATVARIMGERGKRSLIAAAGFPAEWLPTPDRFGGSVGSVRDQNLSYRTLDESEGAITDCALAIAVTGTLVLRHSVEGGRRALSLVPDYLLCVVRAEQIVETVPEGVRALSAFASDALTSISGPSATADIEMIRIKGVHGPRTLEVILVSA
jgi:L-lactate dehydrogenase complex protein LldG